MHACMPRISRCLSPLNSFSLFLYTPRSSGARSALLPLLLLLLTSSGRVLSLLLLHITTTPRPRERVSSSPRGGDLSSSQPRHVLSPMKTASAPSAPRFSPHVDMLAPREEMTTVDSRVSSGGGGEGGGGGGGKRAAVSGLPARDAVTRDAKQEEQDDREVSVVVTEAGRKASLLSLFHCLFLMVPSAVILEVYKARTHLPSFPPAKSSSGDLHSFCRRALLFFALFLPLPLL